MKSLMWLLECMSTNIDIRCSTDTHLDIATIARRIEHEGLSFLTITLPDFAKDLETALERGHVSPNQFMAFKTKAGRVLPTFLGGLLERVFDPVSGKLLDNPCTESILGMRQLCLMFKKIHLPCAEKRIKKAYKKYFECEYELAASFRGLYENLLNENDDELEMFIAVSKLLWPMVLCDTNLAIIESTLVPKHGPGATADRISGNQKYRLKTWHERLQTHFPFDQFGLVNPKWSGDCDPLDEVEFVEPGAEKPVRVITVPKTLKTPRIIAIEPVCMQYTQQALARSIMRMIERHKYTRGHINFVDQQVNRDLALESSCSRKYATVDLSEASDRVHKDLVDLMLSGSGLEELRSAAAACRSTRANVNGQVIDLVKFASMGSALCFPIESMLFFTVCIVARLSELNLPVTPANIFYVSRGIYVYGDDLIVPTDEVVMIGSYLESFGLMVNRHKTFSKGNFRESCGMDAYAGVDVTPVYLRQMPPTDQHSLSELVSFVAFANQLYTRGWWTAAARVREHIESIFGSIPHVRDTSPGLGWASYDNRMTVHKWDPELHRFLVKTYVSRPKYRRDHLDDHYALLKYLLISGEEPANDAKHLERSVRPGRASIKSRWVPS